MDIGSKIRYFRKNKRFSQKKLAELVQISHSAISKYENNERNPTLKTLKNIAKSLDIQVSDLLK